MIHRGETVEKAVRESGYSITKLAKRMGKSRRHIYNVFENPQVPIETVLEIGRIIHYDFSDILPQGGFYISPDSHNISSDNKGAYGPNEQSVEYWKNKYLILLEKYNAVLEKMGEER